MPQTLCVQSVCRPMCLKHDFMYNESCYWWGESSGCWDRIPSKSHKQRNLVSSASVAHLCLTAHAWVQTSGVSTFTDVICFNLSTCDCLLQVDMCFGDVRICRNLKNSLWLHSVQQNEFGLNELAAVQPSSATGMLWWFFPYNWSFYTVLGSVLGLVQSFSLFPLAKYTVSCVALCKHSTPICLIKYAINCGTYVPLVVHEYL